MPLFSILFFRRHTLTATGCQPPIFLRRAIRCYAARVFATRDYAVYAQRDSAEIRDMVSRYLMPRVILRRHCRHIFKIFTMPRQHAARVARCFVIVMRLRIRYRDVHHRSRQYRHFTTARTAYVVAQVALRACILLPPR